MPMDTNSLAQLLNEYLTVTVLWGALGLALLAWSALVWRTCERLLIRSAPASGSRRVPSSDQM